ncbi:MAG: hypothetical protein B6D41_00620 [Chloroflexi bacterium UTCFX4]|jgi:hypothetical protein|nr:MAG: hypothetical protein B6D41_00620 [Chloroflexi bacterium UTCFX4]
MNHARKKPSSKRLSDALERLAELAQTLSPTEWERRLRHMEQDLRTRQNLKFVPNDANLAAPPFSNAPLRADLNTASSWTRYQFPGQNQSIQIQFQIPPQMLYPRMTGQFASRGEFEQKESLILNDIIVHERTHASIQAWLVKLPQDNEYMLRLDIQGKLPLLKHSQVKVKWGAQQLSNPLKRKLFFQIPNPDFSQELALTFKLASYRTTRSHPSPRAIPRMPKRVSKTRAKV